MSASAAHRSRVKMRASSDHTELKENGELLFTRTYLYYQRLTILLLCLRYNHHVDIMHTVNVAKRNNLSPKRRRIDLDKKIWLHSALRQTLISDGLEVIDRKMRKHDFLSPDFRKYSVTNFAVIITCHDFSVDENTVDLVWSKWTRTRELRQRAAL